MSFVPAGTVVELEDLPARGLLTRGVEAEWEDDERPFSMEPRLELRAAGGCQFHVLVWMGEGLGSRGIGVEMGGNVPFVLWVPVEALGLYENTLFLLAASQV